MKKILLGILLNCLICVYGWAQSFDATVNRNTVPEGETFVLTLNLQDVDTSATPDLSALSQDFTVLSVSNGYRTSIINGQVSKSRQWNLVMIPNQTGEAVIPSIKLDNYQTQPITLQVVSAADTDVLVKAQPKAAPQFKMSGKADNLSPYVQQQFNYQLKIYDAGGLQGEAPYFVTNNDDWVIKSLGEPQVETKIVNSKTLREITFNYALFAQKSGEQTIPAVRFNGYYLTKATRTDPFARFFDDEDLFAGFSLNDVFANKNPVILTTDAIKINVRPAAVSSGWWLPAKEVTLSAEFDDKQPRFKFGEAVSRTIYLKAVGVMDTQLPEIKFAQIKGVKQYPEKPQVEMRVENGQVVSYAKIANVYIPEQSGEITLPEIKVDWFNTVAGRTETATIPAYKAMVSQGSAAVLAPVSQPEVVNQPSPKPEKAAPIEQITQVNNTMIIGLLLAAFAGGILLTLMLMKLFVWLGSSKLSHKKAVIAAAQAKDIPRLRDELLLWATSEFPSRKIANLQDVADIFHNAAFNRELDKLRETLYAENTKNWDNQAFLEVFSHISKQIKKHKRTVNEPLPKLYK